MSTFWLGSEVPDAYGYVWGPKKSKMANKIIVSRVTIKKFKPDSPIGQKMGELWQKKGMPTYYGIHTAKYEYLGIRL